MNEVVDSKYKKFKKIVLNILGQILPVMLGVYLGFAMNNFGEAQNLKKQSNVYKSMLKNEIQANLAEVEGVSSYHVDLTNKFQELLESKDIRKDFENSSFQGFRPGFVSSSAYNTGIQTGIIQEFDLELIQALNRLYALQGKYTRFNENMVNSFLANKFPETESEIISTTISTSMSMNDVVIYERDLIKYYGFLLTKL